MISYLADHPEFIAELAPLLHAEWGHLHPGTTAADRAALLQRYAAREAPPIALVAHDGGALWGTASLSPSDRALRPDLTPWLAGVYVVPEHRRRGLGADLVRAVEELAARLGYRSIHLVTAGQEAFYASLGWQVLEEHEEPDETVTVMVRDLADACGPMGHG